MPCPLLPRLEVTRGLATVRSTAAAASPKRPSRAAAMASRSGCQRAWRSPPKPRVEGEGLIAWDGSALRPPPTKLS